MLLCINGGDRPCRCSVVCASRGFEIQHPFFWSHSVFALWEARFSNSTWGSPFPPMKLVVMPVPPNVDFNEWNKVCSCVDASTWRVRVWGVTLAFVLVVGCRARWTCLFRKTRA